MSANHNPKLTLQDFAKLVERLCNPSTTDAAEADDKSQPFQPGTDWHDILEKPIYGRICTNTTSKLAAAPGRKTAFVFGPETLVSEIFMTKSPYEILLHLGFLPEYIHLKACVQKANYWIILFSPKQGPNQVPVLPATWDGLKEFISKCYPKACSSIQNHWTAIQTKPVEYFEEQAGFKFIQAVSDPSKPLYMSYEKFISLPTPQKEWEARCFLYCELRIFELFSGDGVTKNTDGTDGEREYICLNYDKEQLGEGNFVAIPLEIDVPDNVKEEFKSEEK
ncbi:uncharacterized protein [Amphiura filiformis]|uniref:uncharacterized protein n=1 Tax=Amphiura filiformis TaxID=82378 RepID=UPI003B215378